MKIEFLISQPIFLNHINSHLRLLLLIVFFVRHDALIWNYTKILKSFLQRFQTIIFLTWVPRAPNDRGESLRLAIFTEHRSWAWYFYGFLNSLDKGQEDTFAWTTTKTATQHNAAFTDMSWLKYSLISPWNIWVSLLLSGLKSFLVQLTLRPLYLLRCSEVCHHFAFDNILDLVYFVPNIVGRMNATYHVC